MGDEKLIEAVRTFPCLWNTTSATFRDVKAKDAAWKQVASQIGEGSTNKCLKRWKNIRDRFVRELKKTKQNTTEDTGSSYNSAWSMFENLLFLQDVVRHRLVQGATSSSTTDDLSPSLENHLDGCSDDDLLNNTSNLNVSSEVGFHNHSSSASLPSAKRRRIDIDFTPAFSRNSQYNEDEDELFGKQLAATLRRLSGRQKAYAKMQIQKVLLEIEYPEKDKNSSSDNFEEYFIKITARPSLRCYGSRASSNNTTNKFVQEPPALSNTFLKDTFLQRSLQDNLPKEVYADISMDLTQFGERIVTEIDFLGRNAELNPPQLRNNAWGYKEIQLDTSQAWKDLHDVSAEEGLVALGYERKHDCWSRMHQLAKLLLFSPSSGLYSCPLAMTDGAAKLIEISNDTFIKDRAFSHLTSRKPTEFWTSGQWMTERSGGSDVGSSTKTLAFSTQSERWFTLSGEKYFSSATDSNMAFTLARIVDDTGNYIEGSKGLSLFYLETKDNNGEWNKIKLQKLKNKLGTKQLPTAELQLEGSLSYLVGSRGTGISNISPMLTITRLHNSISSVAIMRRTMQLCMDYATKRIAFGKYLIEYPLHMKTLSKMEVQTRGCTLLIIEVSRLLGESECHSTSPETEVLLRYLVSLAKLYTAKQAVEVASEGLECIGGQGYIEDTGLPGLLRDAQVLPIWEGTTNILSLDVVKVYYKHNLQIFSQQVIKNIKKSEQHNLMAEAITLKNQLECVIDFGEKSVNKDINILSTAARDFALSLAHIYIGSLLIKMASSIHTQESDRYAAVRWCSTSILLKEYEYYKTSVHEDYKLTLN